MKTKKRNKWCNHIKKETDGSFVYTEWCSEGGMYGLADVSDWFICPICGKKRSEK
jgi:hypothetical protein